MLLFRGEKIERGPLVQLDQICGSISYKYHRCRTGITAQALEVIERQTKIMRNSNPDRVGVEDDSDNIPWLVVLCADPIQRVGNASLCFQKRFAVGENKKPRGILHDLPNFVHTPH